MLLYTINFAGKQAFLKTNVVRIETLHFFTILLIYTFSDSPGLRYIVQNVSKLYDTPAKLQNFISYPPFSLFLDTDIFMLTFSDGGIIHNIISIAIFLDDLRKK